MASFPKLITDIYCFEQMVTYARIVDEFILQVAFIGPQSPYLPGMCKQSTSVAANICSNS